MASAPRARLLCLEKMSVWLEVSEDLRIGRALQPALWEEVVPCEAARNSISRVHFEVKIRQSRLMVKNLSTGGTFLNGLRITEATLEDGDILSVGQGENGRPALQFQVSVEPQSQMLSLQCLAKVKLPNSRLLAGPTGIVRVGRALQPPEFWQSIVPDEALRNAISRSHFEISPTPDGQIVLVNLSVAGTLLNGNMVQQDHTVKDGDLVGIPLHRRPGVPPIVQFRVECGHPPYPAGLHPSEKEPIAMKVTDSNVTPRPVASPQNGQSNTGDVVQVPQGTLPSPFLLQCISADPSEDSVCTLAAPFAQACISVGSDFLDQTFWTRVLQDRTPAKLESLYFRLFMSQRDGTPTLILHAHAATKLNGVAATGQQPVVHDDVIGIVDGDEPFLCFRVNFLLR
ncbi:unnamed protein product [Durusdinium trenchii]|uniref:FHA domain-containing protein n=1 Tax=Durusdinium trenchii TaxID=1381693 RepID=A0ABP0LCI5_9DINO